MRLCFASRLLSQKLEITIVGKKLDSVNDLSDIFLDKKHWILNR